MLAIHTWSGILVDAMKNTRYFIFSICIVFFISLFSSGCLPVATPSGETNPTSTDQELTQKSGFTTLNGTISQQGTLFLLQTNSGPVTLQTFELDLSEYAGKTVSVTGKYSGDELFVSEIVE